MIGFSEIVAQRYHYGVNKKKHKKIIEIKVLCLLSLEADLSSNFGAQNSHKEGTIFYYEYCNRFNYSN